MTTDTDEWLRKNAVTKCPTVDKRPNNKNEFHYREYIAMHTMPITGTRRKNGLLPKNDSRISRDGDVAIKINRFLDSKHKHRKNTDAMNASGSVNDGIHTLRL